MKSWYRKLRCGRSGGESARRPSSCGWYRQAFAAMAGKNMSELKLSKLCSTNITNIRTPSFCLLSTMANPEEPSAQSPTGSIPYRQNAAEHIRELSRVNAVCFPCCPSILLSLHFPLCFQELDSPISSQLNFHDSKSPPSSSLPGPPSPSSPSGPSSHQHLLPSPQPPSTQPQPASKSFNKPHSTSSTP